VNSTHNINHIHRRTSSPYSAATRTNLKQFDFAERVEMHVDSQVGLHLLRQSFQQRVFVWTKRFIVVRCDRLHS